MSPLLKAVAPAGVFAIQKIMPQGCHIHRKDSRLVAGDSPLVVRSIPELTRYDFPRLQEALVVLTDFVARDVGTSRKQFFELSVPNRVPIWCSVETVGGEVDAPSAS